MEFASIVSTERDADWVGAFDTGLLYWLTEDLQFSAGVAIGLTRAADDWNPFAAMAWRF